MNQASLSCCSISLSLLRQVVNNVEVFSVFRQTEHHSLSTCDCDRTQRRHEGLARALAARDLACLSLYYSFHYFGH